MSGPLRPNFSEGQILAAADLNLGVTYERLGAVLHERTEHLWGVAAGLQLTPSAQRDDGNGNKYVDVTLAPGRAVDRLGRPIVITTAVPLLPADFTDQVASPKDNELYPVFVQAIEIPRSGETQPGKCAVGSTSRIEESVQISFGTPGSEISILEQTEAPVADGFGTPTLFDKVLVGWVSFRATGSRRFAGVATSSGSTQLRYIGVVASDVVAGGGTLTLHSRPDGNRFALQILEDGAGGALLKFGKETGPGKVTSLFSVDEQGNIIANSIKPAPVAKVLAESGTAFHGVVLPLPLEVSDPTAVRAHIVVTPLMPAPQSIRMVDGSVKAALPFIETCAVDDQRKVTCTIRWFNRTDFTDSIVYPAACTYLLIATGE